MPPFLINGVDIRRVPSLVMRNTQEMVAPFTIYILDRVVPFVRDMICILHDSFIIDHREPEPVMNVQLLVPPVRSLIVIFYDSHIELHRLPEPVVDVNMVRAVSSIAHLARSTVSVLGSLANNN
ncbi:uncharacterized protein Dwil_GK18903 [Drosophila willistoni]|uniref:Uncharacterized protein n=1 Tax=Drosophila willistoni TaxID=7260 RepID=B4MYU3_DROWI|nr:uncharacterized protein LOC6643601 [Drosophila willistoni]EDW77282.2 uncharacterized protein Dwil_GK18903 [Drosophila willistoni]